MSVSEAIILAQVQKYKQLGYELPKVLQDYIATLKKNETKSEVIISEELDQSKSSILASVTGLPLTGEGEAEELDDFDTILDLTFPEEEEDPSEEDEEEGAEEADDVIISSGDEAEAEVVESVGRTEDK